jgi:hypothetical protein
VLAIHHGAGVTKKTKRGRKAVPSSKAKRRQEKAADKAEAILGRTGRKVERSMSQLKQIRKRRKPWDEVNKSIPGGRSKTSGYELLADMDEKERDAWQSDEDMDMVGEEATVSGEVVPSQVAPEQVSLPPAEEGEEEIL